MTNYNSLFADILNIAPFTATPRLFVELCSDNRSVIYHNDEHFMIVYNSDTSRLEIWQINHHKDLYTFIDSKPVDNDSVKSLQKLAKLLADKAQDDKNYYETIGNNGEDIVEYNEDDPREDR